MKRSFRITLGAAAFALVAACVVNLSFDMAKDVQVDATGTTVNTVQAIDLNDYAEVQQHKANIESLGLDSVDATVSVIA